MAVITLRLDIDGTSHILPTFENAAIQVTKKVADIDRLNSSGVITKQRFRVPIGNEFIKAVGDLTNLGQESLVNINQSIKGYIMVDAFTRFKGSFQILDAYFNNENNSKEADVLFIGNETDLKTELSKVKMSEMFEGEFLNYTAAELDDYFSTPFPYRDATGYMWPLIDYGQRYTVDTAATEGTIVSDTYNFSQLNFKPSVTLFKCFELLPIDITTDSSLDEIMDYTILLHNSVGSVPVLDTSERDYTGYMDRSSAGSQALPLFTYTKIVFNREYNYNQDQIDLPNDEFDIPVTGLYTFRVKGDIQFTTSNGSYTNYQVAFKLMDAGVAGGGLVYATWVRINSANPQTVSFDFTYQSQHTAGQAIGLGILVNTDSNCTILPQTDFRFEMVKSPSLTASSAVDIAANCPDLTAWDILSGVANMCKGVIQTNSDGTYNLIPWVEWIDDNSDVVYLGDKIQQGTVKIEPFSVKGAKSIKLTYQEDEDFYNKKYKEIEGGVYGELYIEDTGTDFSKEEFKVELPWAASVPAPMGGNGIPIIHLYDSSYKPIKGKPRLIQNTGTEYVDFQFNLVDAITAASYTYSQIPNMTNWSISTGGYTAYDSNFGKSLTFFASEGYPNNTLYQQFWKQYIEETYTQNARKVTADVAFTQSQIDTFQFNEQFFYKGAKLRLTGLNNISLNSRIPTQSEFMKRVTIENIDIAPFYPYDVILGIVQWKNSSTNADLGDASGQAAADVEESALAYGFYYDSNQNIANERGQILEI